MICKAKGDFGQMPPQKSKKYGISPVDGKENKNVWPPGSKFFCIAKGEEYNVEKPHPFFEGGNKISDTKKVQHDSPRPTDKGKGS